MKNSSYSAWPFLIGSSVKNDYCLIVFPHELNDSAIEYALMSISDEKSNDKKYYCCFSLDDTSSVTVAFQRRYALESDISSQGKAFLEDGYGRKITLTEGLIFPCCIPTDNLNLCDSAFDVLLSFLRQESYYKVFYHEGLRFRDIPTVKFEVCQDSEKLICFEILPKSE